ncbi:acyltransferase family protein [Massilia sp. S19_KUP03_FR1]|uniref:acyltransferase family protein n=1 Tax=Massilia sp. S19_KUP03_FR1 TaxID=3025503 RepID=UPI002FCD71E1
MATFHPSTRLAGLDTLRALAVTLVVLHHYTLFVTRDAHTFGWVGQMGWAGVDLFFALSGHLIGRQIFAAMADPRGLSLGRFYARRLLRTLPNFYVVVALYFLLPGFRGEAPLPDLWRLLTFTLNFRLPPGTAFSHAWSLCIEEQFYMVLPAVALLAAWLCPMLRGTLRLAWVALALLVMGGMLWRAQLWQDVVDANPYGENHYFKFIYYATLCRADELLAGVALALVRQYHPRTWAWLTRQGNLSALLGLAVLGLASWLFLDDRYGRAPTVFGYPLLALGFSLLILAALSEKSLLRAVRIPGAASIALWSYAIYLLHRQVCVLGAGVLKQYGYAPDSVIAVGVLLLASVLTGAVLFYAVETPFMRLRERYFPTSVRALRLGLNDIKR